MKQHDDTSKDMFGMLQEIEYLRRKVAELSVANAMLRIQLGDYELIEDKDLI